MESVDYRRCPREGRALAVLTVAMCLFRAVHGGMASDYEVVAPNGGEIFSVGDTCIMRFAHHSPFPDLPRANYFISVDGGKEWLPLAVGVELSPLSEDCASLALSIPESLTVIGNRYSLVSQRCLVKVADYLDPNDADVSDSLFSVVPAGSGIRQRQERASSGRAASRRVSHGEVVDPRGRRDGPNKRAFGMVIVVEGGCRPSLAWGLDTERLLRVDGGGVAPHRD